AGGDAAAAQDPLGRQEKPLRPPRPGAVPRYASGGTRGQSQTAQEVGARHPREDAPGEVATPKEAQEDQVQGVEAGLRSDRAKPSIRGTYRQFQVRYLVLEPEPV